MRIIAGQFKGRRFTPPANKWPTRPTTDFAKEGLFNVLYNNFDFEGLKVLDLFGGTGNLSYEFISRGCEDVTYVEQYGPCVAFVKRLARELNIAKQIRIVKGDVFKFIHTCPTTFGIVFADPPYDLPTLASIPDKVFEKGLVEGEGWFILEHDRKHDFEDHPNFIRQRKYGNALFSFFENKETTSDEEE